MFRACLCVSPMPVCRHSVTRDRYSDLCRTLGLAGGTAFLRSMPCLPSPRGFPMRNFPTRILVQARRACCCVRTTNAK